MGVCSASQILSALYNAHLILVDRCGMLPPLVVISTMEHVHVFLPLPLVPCAWAGFSVPRWTCLCWGTGEAGGGGGSLAGLSLTSLFFALCPNTQRPMYGANVIVLEGIMTFCHRDLLDLMDLKIFVDTDSDIRLARRWCLHGEMAVSVGATLPLPPSLPLALQTQKGHH